MFRSNMCPAPPRRSSSAPMGRPDKLLFTALDNLIAQKRVPVMIAISIGNGGGDAQGSQRGLEYDTMSGHYAEFVENGSAAAGGRRMQREADQRSRRPRHHGRQFRRVVRPDHGLVSPRAVSPRADLFRHLRQPAVARQPGDAARRLGISRTPDSQQPGQADPHLDGSGRSRQLLNAMRDNMHDWVLANEKMAKVLADKGYHYQFVFAKNAGHTDGTVKAADAA